MTMDLYYEEDDKEFIVLAGCVGKLYFEMDPDYFEFSCDKDYSINSDLTKVGSYDSFESLAKAAKTFGKKKGIFD